jgi:hypothetical protein
MATYLPNVTDVIPEPALFTPNFPFIDTMLRRRQGLYEQGFAQVNSAYNFVNRSVTNPYSSKVRDEFLAQANQNLKNLSSLDLSQQQNVRMAAGVFEPFVKNRAVLGDMAVTAHWNQQLSIADSFRLKDGGKEYSEDNVNYIRQQMQAFANDDISSVGQYYANRRSYTPYYDWNKEMQDAMKNFKPSSVKLERINGMYMVTTKDASWTKEEINKYLSSVLSDKAKQQMRIEAAVRYPDLNAVSGLYMSQAAQDLPQIEARVNMMNEALKSEKDDTKRSAIQEERDFYTERAKEIRGNIENIQKGDVSFLKNNAQRLAETIYIGQAVGRLANGFSHKDVEQTIGFNQVAMMYARMAFDREENEKNRNAENKDFPFIPVQLPGEQVTTDYNSLQKKVTDAEKFEKSSFTELKDYIIATDANQKYSGKTSATLTEDDVESWINSHPDHPKAIAFTKAATATDVAKEMLTNWDKDADAYAREQMGGEYETLEKWREAKKTIANNESSGGMWGIYNPNANVRWDPVKQTYIKVLFPAQNGRPEITQDLGKNYYESSGTGGSRAFSDQRLYEKSLDNKANDVLGLNTGSTYRNWLGIAVTEKGTGDALEEKYQNLKKEFNSAKNTVTSVTRQGITMNVNDKDYKSTKGYLEALTGLDGKIAGISWFPSATNYTIQFKLDDANATNPVDREAVSTTLKAKLGTEDVKYDEKTDQFTVGKIGPLIANQLDPFRNVEPLHREILAGLEVYNGSPGSKRTSVPFFIQGLSGNVTFSITKLYGNSPESNTYILLANNKPIDMPFESTMSAYSAAFGLANNPQALTTILNAK